MGRELKPPEVVRLNGTISIRTYKDTLFNYVDYFLLQNKLPDKSFAYLCWSDHHIVNGRIYSDRNLDFRISLRRIRKENWYSKRIPFESLRKIRHWLLDMPAKAQIVISFKLMGKRCINVDNEDWQDAPTYGLSIA